MPHGYAQSRLVGRQLQDAAAVVDGHEHILRTAYEWPDEHNPLKLIKEAAKAIPVVGEKVASVIEATQARINELLETTLGALWNAAIDGAVARINKVIAIIRSQTNVTNKKKQGANKTLGGVSDLYDANGNPINGIAPQSYTPPSHTEIAKDHNDILNPAKDAQADRPDEGLDRDHTDHDHEDSDGEHGHTHIPNYLAPLADGLAKMASVALGEKVAACWNIVDAQEEGPPDEQTLDAALTGINTVVNEYCAHPADCNYWREHFISQLKTVRLGAAVKARLGDY